MRAHALSGASCTGAKQAASARISEAVCRARDLVGILHYYSFLVMEESSSTPAPDRHTDSAISIERADLEALIGQVVRREMASQQAGPSVSSQEGGELFRIAPFYFPPPTWPCPVGVSGLHPLPSSTHGGRRVLCVVGGGGEEPLCLREY